MSYRDQLYYREYRELLDKLKSSLSDMKDKNERLEEENRSMSEQLKSVRMELAGARKEIETVKSQAGPGSSGRSQEASATDSDAGRPSASGTSPTGIDNMSPSLFDHLSENEKIVLRQQIRDLITRIDRHLSSNGDV